MTTPATTAVPRETEQVVVLIYVNHRGERAQRRVIPERVWFGSTEWHPEPQWLLDAWDLGRRAERSFAMKDIESFMPDTPRRVSDR